MKNYFIGIDVSKEKVDVSVILRHEGLESVSRMGHEVFPNSKQGFLRMLQWNKRLTGVEITSDNALFCCETTGSYDLHLCNYLYTKGLFIWRENALQIKRSTGLRRGKDDVTDSWAIAEYALRHADKAVCYNPLSPEIKALKELVNYRSVLTKRLSACKIRLKEMVGTAVEKSAAMRFIMNDTKKQITLIEKSLKQCEEEIKALIKENEEIGKNYKHITSIPGIGIVNATALIAYTNNFQDFRNANALATYMGLAAFREQSGTSINRAVRVGCYSNRQLKGYISQAAQIAVMHNPRIRDYYMRLIAIGKHQGVAMNNVRNKLVHILFSLVKHDCDYETNHEETIHFNKNNKNKRA